MSLALDLGIIVLYFVVISTIGLVMGKREKSLLDFALGGRKIPWWAIMASIIAAETSAATFLGAPSEGFRTQSLVYVQLVIGVILGRYVVASFFLKPYYTYKVYTVYDYLLVRFGPISKTFVSFLFLIMRTLASGTRLFVPAIAMVLAWQVFMNDGHPVVVSQNPVTSVWPYVIAIVIVCLMTSLYTVKGGIKAVIWTDLVQASLMFGSALIAIWLLVDQVGGFGALLHMVPRMGTIQGYFVSGFDHGSIQNWQVDQKIIPKGAAPLSMGFWDYVREIFTNDYTLLSAFIASSATNIAAFGADQDMVQRLLTASEVKSAKRSLMTAAVMDLPIGLAFTFIGVLLVAFYQLHPQFKPSSNSDIFAAYILDVMPPGLRGIVLAGVFATTMGSLSTALNSLASSATNDFYVPYKANRNRANQTGILRAARFFTVLFAILMIVVAGVFAYVKVTRPDVGILPVVLGIAGILLGPMLGVFLLGMFTKNRGSDRGNVFALISGLVAIVLVGDIPGKISPSWSLHLLPWTVSFTWFGLIGAVGVIMVGIWFRTPGSVLDQAAKRESEAQTDSDLPLALRGAGNSAVTGQNLS